MIIKLANLVRQIYKKLKTSHELNSKQPLLRLSSSEKRTRDMKYLERGKKTHVLQDPFRILLDTFGVATKYFENSKEKSFGVPISKQMRELKTKINKIIEGYAKVRSFFFSPYAG